MLALPGYAWTKAVGVEDCLYLNVYAPASAATATEPLAVMVFIHGGYAMGGSARPDDLQYGSSVEMPAEGVIHVNIQYRLGVMGFLGLNDGETVANVGLLDQLSAASAMGGCPLPAGWAASPGAPPSPWQPSW